MTQVHTIEITDFRDHETSVTLASGPGKNGRKVLTFITHPAQPSEFEYVVTYGPATQRFNHIASAIRCYNER